MVFLPNSYCNGPGRDMKNGKNQWKTVCFDSRVLYEPHPMLYPHKCPTYFSTLLKRRPNVSASVPSLGVGSLEEIADEIVKVTTTWCCIPKVKT